MGETTLGDRLRPGWGSGGAVQPFDNPLQAMPGRGASAKRNERHRNARGALSPGRLPPGRRNGWRPTRPFPL